MSDIVKRLRGRQALVLGGRPYADLYRDAADEIERLRKLIDGAAETGEIYERRLSECEAENDALRSRLADIEAQNRVMWDVANDREARLAEAQDKALRFDLDQTGIEARERDAVELVELRSRLAETERDAARYRWLRDCSNGEVDWPNSQWDAAIDAEIAADRENGSYG